MTEGNVELVREWFARWNRGERSFDEIEAHPDAEIVSRFRPDPYRGREGFEEWVAEIDQHFEDWQPVVDEWHGAPEAVVAIGHPHLHGHGSGIAFDQPMAWLVELDDRRLRRLRNYDKPEEALRAAGLAK